MTRLIFSARLLTLLAWCCGLVAAALLAGGLLYKPRAFAAELAETERCQFPCWRGIRPGSTERIPVHEFLVTAGYRAESPSGSIGSGGIYYGKATPERCSIFLSFQSHRVSRIELIQCPGLTLGDLMVVLGRPDGVDATGGWVAFRGGALLAELRCDTRVAPELAITTLRLAGTEAAQGRDLVPWAGFMSRARYTQRAADDPTAVWRGCRGLR